MKPLISIIIPVYNAEKYIEQCVNSILRQSEKNWELILINDGSTDLTGEICDNYKIIDTRVKVFHIKNSGVSYARNMGIKNSCGKYIMFVDSDDWIHNEMVEDMLKSINNTDNNLVISGVINVFNNKVVEKSFVKSEIIDLSHKKSEDFLKLINDYNIYGPCRKIYIKQIIDENNLCFNEELFFGEDLVFNLEYLEYVKKISLMEKSYYYYRMNEESITNKFNLKKIYNINKINVYLSKFVNKRYSDNNKIYIILKERFIKEYILAITQLINTQKYISIKKIYTYLSELCKSKNIYNELNIFMKELDYKKRIKYLFYINNPLLWLFYIKLLKVIGR